MDILSAEFLARLQFAFTVSFHIIFPSFTIGLSVYLVLIEALYLKTKDIKYKLLYKKLNKIFAVCFGVGVVTGVVLSYQIGTNWGGFAYKTGNVLGPLLGYEVLTAFFLEASFLGIMLFGMEKVSKKVHFTSTVIVSIGTLISGFWILSANSWMQTPGGYTVDENGIFHAVDWMKIVFNESFGYRYFHMIIAAFLTTSFVVAGISSYKMLKNQDINHYKNLLFISLIAIIFLAPTQYFVGHEHGKNTMKHQPLKVATMEGNFETGKNVDLILFGIPSHSDGKINYPISIPSGASYILTGKTDGVVPGINDFAKDERPPLGPVFWSFRIMVGIGGLMILVSIFALYSVVRKNYAQNKTLQKILVAMSPSGFIAILAGWFVTEIGRQPYIVYGVLKTKDSLSPVISEHIMISLSLFIVIYISLLILSVKYIFKIIKQPLSSKDNETFYDHSIEKEMT